jgi:hypothetical protein
VLLVGSHIQCPSFLPKCTLDFGQKAVSPGVALAHSKDGEPLQRLLPRFAMTSSNRMERSVARTLRTARLSAVRYRDFGSPQLRVRFPL